MGDTHSIHVSEEYKEAQVQERPDFDPFAPKL
jgi:hypothetical protein